VLIRALEPLEGVDVMRRRRSRPVKGRPHRRTGDPFALHDLCRGPGNLAMAMGITLKENRLDLLGECLYIDDRGLPVADVAWGPRVGINVGVERPWRAWIRGHLAVSR
jgi:DNA-3-methyladenine glycosylase